MMSTPSSSTRPPPTSPQVTASVVKFRCLYTHDLRRKSKRWHDGHLRYHKHNKRVMVYDDQGNFIGDHHWRSTDEVQDGDEMELDKGVLIEVTENMGTTETDITTLYEKKKSSQGSPPARDPRSPSTYTPSASVPLRGSQSFRSLYDLLGIKKTPIGHLISPHEERNPPQPASSLQEPERAPKRQKTSSVVNRGEQRSRVGEVIDLTDSTDSVQGLSERERPKQLKKPHRAGGDSTADAALPVNREQRSKPTRPQRPNPPSFSSASASTASEPISSLPTTEELFRTPAKGFQPARSLGNKSKDNPPPIQPPRPRGPSTSSLPTVTPETEIPRPRETLCVEQPSISRENRSRALSRPIPPQRSDPPAASRSSLTSAPKPSSARSTPQTPVRAVSNYVNPIEPVCNQASINVPASVNIPPPANVPPTVNIPSPANISSSANIPLPANVLPTVNVPSPVNISSSTSMPPPSRPSSTLRSGAPTSSLRMGVGKPRRKLMYSALLPGASRTPSPATSDTSPGSASEPATNTPEQQLAAVPGDSSISNEEFMPSSSTQFIFDEMIDGSGFKSPSTIKSLTGKRSLNSPLRKSMSDPIESTTRQVRAGGPLHAANKENEPREQGPWTSEALDLFDFWPAGRPKPNE
ncbi:hypothetical protein CBS147325_4223 [Penicillium roqueforti]|nr:hypothetical protein CBS147325_4223 [Penicillium roqueforti]KAI3162442.1 hypothetical protein DTO046C5_6102 [Penicillium roqueforti]